MTYSREHIARALAEEVRSQPREQLPALVDAALLLLHMHHKNTSLRSFPRLVLRALRRTGAIDARLRIPAGTDAASTLDTIRTTLAQKFGPNLTLDLEHDASFWGGAVLDIGDERLDASMPGLLHHLEATLTAPSSPVPFSS